MIFRNKIALSKDETMDKLKEWEDINIKLKEELKEITEKLILKGNELTGSKTELIRHRNEIDVSFIFQISNIAINSYFCFFRD